MQDINLGLKNSLHLNQITPLPSKTCDTRTPTPLKSSFWTLLLINKSIGSCSRSNYNWKKKTTHALCITLVGGGGGREEKA